MVPGWLEKLFYTCSDSLFSHLTQAKPSLKKLQATKIISHRGERDNQIIFENTFSAYDPLVETQVSGIECDIRWSKDDVPMVFHDKNCERLFNDAMVISEHTAADIQKRHPLIPSLKQLIERYSGRFHFMIELKKESFAFKDKHSQILKETLAPIKAIRDYHLISLVPAIFEAIDFAPSQAYFPIAIFNSKRLSDLIIEKEYAGLFGHYALLPKRILNRHEHTGSGHIASQNALFREINRGVEWIFCNEAVKIQTILNQAIETSSS